MKKFLLFIHATIFLMASAMQTNENNDNKHENIPFSLAKRLIVFGKTYRYDPDFLPSQWHDLYRMQEAQRIQVSKNNNLSA